MGRERMVNEDKQAMGKRANSVACAFKRSKPVNNSSLPPNVYRSWRSQWETDVITVLEAFESTNKFFPRKHFLTLCGFEGSPV